MQATNKTEEQRAINSLLLSARIYRHNNELENARVMLDRVLARQEKLNGPESPEVAVTLYKLADLLCDQGQFNLARSLFLRASSIWHKNYPNDSILPAHASLLSHVYSEVKEDLDDRKQAGAA
jgi:hypothetical protein